jgi:hypothetical protein
VVFVIPSLHQNALSKLVVVSISHLESLDDFAKTSINDLFIGGLIVIVIVIVVAVQAISEQAAAKTLYLLI